MVIGTYKMFAATLTLLLILIAFTIGAIMYNPQRIDPFLNKNKFNEHTIYINDDIKINVAIADTQSERTKGLGGVEFMGPGEGMLFVFDKNDKWRIWMKDMLFGIDIIWIDENGKIIDIREFVYPETYEKLIPDVFEPIEPARYVLEVVAGFAGANGIKVGDMVQLGIDDY